MKRLSLCLTKSSPGQTLQASFGRIQENGHWQTSKPESAAPEEGPCARHAVPDCIVLYCPMLAALLHSRVCSGSVCLCWRGASSYPRTHEHIQPLGSASPNGCCVVEGGMPGVERWLHLGWLQARLFSSLVTNLSICSCRRASRVLTAGQTMYSVWGCRAVTPCPGSFRHLFRRTSARRRDGYVQILVFVRLGTTPVPSPASHLSRTRGFSRRVGVGVQPPV